jgi:pyruvate ferredoxin oxidoreductase beta subunit
MVSIMVAHRIPYAATACVSFPDDLLAKVRKASSIRGPAYLHVLCPCPTGWGFDPSKTVEVGRLAVMTGMWVLYEVEGGRRRLTFKPEGRLPVSKYLMVQGRFKHLNEAEVAEVQRFVDESCREWGI